MMHSCTKIKNSISEDTTKAYFDPTKQTILRTEASFNEAFAAALVHFIGRSMTEIEKRYSQTEKDALAIKWAKEGL